MSYYRIQYNYRLLVECARRHNVAGRGETALNAMFCGFVKSEEAITSLFRPNYLKHETIKYSPQSEGIVGPTTYLDFDETLNGLQKHLKRVEAELCSLRSALTRNGYA
ncbi:MAG: hypothetical protein JSV64_02635 [Candidatus Bathyarchaeota archaeon]|nr:MAG: hypothetical protein JSV64_02635 [Candidatus Bathyarchaeota archaeon]